MKPAHFDGETAVFHVIEEGQVVAGTELPLLHERDELTGQMTLTSVWELDDEERELVANGANIELRTWGGATPPVSLAVSARQVVVEDTATVDR